MIKKSWPFLVAQPQRETPVTPSSTVRSPALPTGITATGGGLRLPLGSAPMADRLVRQQTLGY